MCHTMDRIGVATQQEEELNSHNSASLLSMPFALNCMIVKYCVGIEGGSGCGFSRVGGWGTA